MEGQGQALSIQTPEGAWTQDNLVMLDLGIDLTVNRAILQGAKMEDRVWGLNKLTQEDLNLKDKKTSLVLLVKLVEIVHNMVVLLTCQDSAATPLRVE
jgi:hypothetical protein